MRKEHSGGAGLLNFEEQSSGSTGIEGFGKNIEKLLGEFAKKFGGGSRILELGSREWLNGGQAGLSGELYVVRNDDVSVLQDVVAKDLKGIRNQPHFVLENEDVNSPGLIEREFPVLMHGQFAGGSEVPQARVGELFDREASQRVGIIIVRKDDLEILERLREEALDGSADDLGSILGREQNGKEWGLQIRGFRGSEKRWCIPGLGTGGGSDGRDAIMGQ